MADLSGSFGLVEVVLAVEREFGVVVSDEVAEACGTPRELVLELAAGSTAPALAEMEAVVCRVLARLLERDATSEDLTKSWCSLFTNSIV